jgi:hypothetical protein
VADAQLPVPAGPAVPAVPAVPAPDDKDWTWVLERPCADCGYEAASVPFGQLGARSLVAVATLRQALTGDDAKVRPASQVWSPLEYAAHVRDVCELFRQRLQLMLDQVDPLFANWDQDETAVASKYWEQQPTVVSSELEVAARAMAGALDLVEVDQRQRSGRRTNGSTFTVETLGRYYLHDLVHHAHDVRSGPQATQ